LEDTVEVLLTIVACGFGVLFLLILLGLIGHLKERSLVGPRYEWLSLLSHYEWKPVREVRDEMKKKKQTKSSLMIVYHDMYTLQQEGLIQTRPLRQKLHGYVLVSYECLLTPGGTRKKLDSSDKQVGTDILGLQHI
jgi:hypothetical protein